MQLDWRSHRSPVKKSDLVCYFIFLAPPPSLLALLLQTQGLGVGWMGRGESSRTVRSLIDWCRYNLAIDILCKVDAQILPFLMVCLCGLFRDSLTTHPLVETSSLRYSLIGTVYHLTVFPLGCCSQTFLLMGSSFLCWSCQIRSEETTWPTENMVPWKPRSLSVPCHCEQLQPAFSLQTSGLICKCKFLSFPNTRGHMWGSPINCPCFSRNTGRSKFL